MKRKRHGPDQIIAKLREADAIADSEMRKADLTKAIWQFPVVLLPFGTKEGGRSIVLRPIASTDAMTANAAPIPAKVLKKMTEGILKLKGIDAVLVSVDSISSLRRAYPNYFLDTHVFIEAVKEAVSGQLRLTRL